MKYLLPEKWKCILLINHVDCDQQFLIYVLSIKERDIKVWKVHKFICNTDLLQIGIKWKIFVIPAYFPEVAYLKSELWKSPYSFYHMNCYLFHHSSSAVYVVNMESMWSCLESMWPIPFLLTIISETPDFGTYK